MAERTGDPDLDHAIASFIAADEPLDATGDDESDEANEGLVISDMRSAACAQWNCDLVAGQFVEYLARIGVIEGGDELLDEAVEQLVVSGTCSDWYDDAPNELEHPGHTVVEITRGSRTYSIDFTASQYGYSEFPLVQQKDSDGAWQRSWRPDLADLNVSTHRQDSSGSTPELDGP